MRLNGYHGKPFKQVLAIAAAMSHQTTLHTKLATLLVGDPERSRILHLVRSLQLPDCWIGAGFVRNAVWDSLLGRPAKKPSGDVDVIWFDATRTEKELDTYHENLLRSLDESVHWSVKNQARMHAGNGDAPYLSATDAMRYWPETATAVAARYGDSGELDIAAPFGLTDLFGAIVRPAGRFATEKREQFEQRLIAKEWRTTWPMLRVEQA